MTRGLPASPPPPTPHGCHTCPACPSPPPLTHRPEKYDRELVKKTVKAIERISEIRTRRQERYYEKRMAKVKGQQVRAGHPLLLLLLHFECPIAACCLQLVSMLTCL